MIQHFHDIIRIFSGLQIFFSILLLKSGIKSTRFWNSSISLRFSVRIRFQFLFLNVILTTVFRCWSTFWNSTLKVTMLFWQSQRLLANTNVEIDNVDSTMFNVASFKVDIHLVVSTLIWLCPTLRRHINPTTLKQRWNVACETFFHQNKNLVKKCRCIFWSIKWCKYTLLCTLPNTKATVYWHSIKQFF